MLATLTQVLDMAKEKNIAIGAFNATGLESIKAIIDSAEELNLPVVLSHAECHEEYVSLEYIADIMVLKAEKAKVPVCVNLDHGENIDYIKKAIKLGFTAVMYDGSALDYDDNIKNTKTVVEMAQKYGISVEGEIGVVGGREGKGDLPKVKSMYTDPLIAKEYCDETKIDALACSFGTAHGFYSDTPHLDFERIREIKNLTDKPIVMHGGSGLSEEVIRKAIKCGVRKVNYYSYMSKAGTETAREILSKSDPHYHELSYEVYRAMRNDVSRAIKAFSFID